MKLNLNNFVIFLIFGLIVFSITVDCNKKRNRYRGKRPKGTCGLSELDKCLDRLETYRNNTDTFKLLKDSNGFNEICSTVQDTISCFKLYVERCGTPLQYEFFDFALEYFTKSIDKFCKPGEQREEFLKHSPCLVSKVLGTQEIKKKCNDPYLATIEKMDKNSSLDARLDSVCCSHNRWEDCLLTSIEKECGKQGRESTFNFLDKAFAGLIRMVCNHDEFDHKMDKCKAVFAPEGAQVDLRKSNHPVIKYLSSYFVFLFN
ncbi:uncharacterized protein LOC128396520 [Panonychus citri]|uniref:uncharacterized protein LOC128396520 n=1 Tax=Panonychus citri TaxID=50023 RepID=UPI0023082D42|nr:uncharacterized protein LOC128396520 [Panonychus citri]